MDVGVASAGLLLGAPVIGTVALAVRLRLGRPVLFRQSRPGLEGRPFTIYKFRTMRDGDASDADRLDRFGSWLRSTSLDELPELWNVLRGDMSLVGPRPLLTSYLDRYDDEQRRRHDVRPGMTGLAQTDGRNAIDWDRRLALDVEYVDRWTLRLDLRILLRTLAVVLRADGVSAPGHATMPEFEPAGDHR